MKSENQHQPGALQLQPVLDPGGAGDFPVQLLKSAGQHETSETLSRARTYRPTSVKSISILLQRRRITQPPPVLARKAARRPKKCLNLENLKELRVNSYHCKF